MASFQGFIGGSDPSLSLIADAQRCVNLYPETIESAGGRNKSVLYGTPGLSLLTTLPEGAYRGSFAQEGRYFCVVGSGFYEVDAAGTFTNWGSPVADADYVSLCTNGIVGHQLGFCAGGLGYLFDTNANTFTPITAAGFPPGALQMNDRDDTFFVLSTGGRLQASALGDGTSWNAAQFGQRSQSSDAWVAMLWVRDQLWLWGTRTSEAWYDAGNAGFPLAAIPGGFMEIGIAAKATACLHDQAPTWLAQDARGGRMVVRGEGFAPRRVSTHAVEYALASYSRVDDAVAWAEQHAGHEWYVLTSPSWPTTWVYDGSTQQWHERQHLNPATGAYESQRGITHAYSFGKHLVGDRANGNLYVQAIGTYDDAGAPLPAIRRSPTVANGDAMIWHDRFALITQAGSGLVRGPGAAPLVSLRWSDDGGQTWGNSVTASLGAMGAYQQRVEWRRLGGTRFGRVYETTITDPIPRVLVDALLDVTKGTN
jgi:hypothetical protein